MKKIFLIWISISFCVVAISGFTYAEGMNTKIADKIMSKPEVELRLAARKLWESSATLQRDYIVSAANDSKDANVDRDKLLKNADDLGASIQPYYGYAARGILTSFLKNDVFLTGEVIKAAKIGNKKALNWSKKKWYSNAFFLAGFFAIPRNQTMKDLTDMLYEHLDLTWGEIQSILKKDNAEDLEYYEKDRAHMLMFSDVLTNGIVKQFPNKFKE